MSETELYMDYMDFEKVFDRIHGKGYGTSSGHMEFHNRSSLSSSRRKQPLSVRT